MSFLSDEIRSGTKETDGQIFIPAWDFQFDVGAWTLTRDAAGNYKMRKTAAANTPSPSINLSSYLTKKIGADSQPIDARRDIRGFQVKKLHVVYAIGTVALTAHTYDLVRATYANNLAVVLDATIGGTLSGALATATQANPYVTPITVGTPFIVGNNVDLVTDWFELFVNAAATTVYDLYGVFVDYNYNLL